MTHPTFEPRIYFVTTIVNHRRHFFVTRKRAAKLGLVIRNACRMKGFGPLTYAILPNHFHLLVLTMSPRTLESERGEGQDYPRGEEGNVRWGKQSKKQLDLSRSVARSDRNLSRLMQSIKGNFSWQETDGKFWQARFNVCSVSDDASLGRVTDYIVRNYIKTNLPDYYGQPPFVFYDQKLFESLNAEGDFSDSGRP